MFEFLDHRSYSACHEACRTTHPKIFQHPNLINQQFHHIPSNSPSPNFHHHLLCQVAGNTSEGPVCNTSCEVIVSLISGRSCRCSSARMGWTWENCDRTRNWKWWPLNGQHMSKSSWNVHHLALRRWLKTSDHRGVDTGGPAPWQREDYSYPVSLWWMKVNEGNEGSEEALFDECSDCGCGLRLWRLAQKFLPRYGWLINLI